MKFGDDEAIIPSKKAVEGLRAEVQVMEQLWSHISLCLEKFEGYMQVKWLDT